MGWGNRKWEVRNEEMGKGALGNGNAL